LAKANKYNIYEEDKIILENVTEREAEKTLGKTKVHFGYYATSKRIYKGKCTVEYADKENHGESISYPFSKETYAEWTRMNERYGNIVEVAK